jgi:hypothetical protein
VGIGSWQCGRGHRWGASAVSTPFRAQWADGFQVSGRDGHHPLARIGATTSGPPPRPAAPPATLPVATCSVAGRRAARRQLRHFRRQPSDPSSLRSESGSWIVASTRCPALLPVDMLLTTGLPRLSSSDTCANGMRYRSAWSEPPASELSRRPSHIRRETIEGDRRGWLEDDARRRAAVGGDVGARVPAPSKLRTVLGRREHPVPWEPDSTTRTRASGPTRAALPWLRAGGYFEWPFHIRGGSRGGEVACAGTNHQRLRPTGTW